MDSRGVVTKCQGPQGGPSQVGFKSLKPFLMLPPSVNRKSAQCQRMEGLLLTCKLKEVVGYL